MTPKTIVNKRITRLLLALMLAGILLTLAVSGTAAQNYSFAVDKLTANVTISSQGVMSVDYVYAFTNQAGASPIDYIDIGLPSTDYDLSSVKADVDGKTISDITHSSYVSGITLGLGGNAIQPGAKGTVHVIIGTINSILFPSTQQSKNYASFNFSPNYFGSQYIKGSTDETISLHLPPGIQSSEPVYYTPQGWPGDKTPQISYDSANEVTYTWQAANASESTEYIFGAAFPASYVPASALVVKPTAAPVTGSSSSSGSSSTGCIVTIAVIFGLIAIFSSIGGRSAAERSKLDYLPPKISVEGHGIKRGLTAVEAAILMELPLDKVMTMILFGVLKKGAATVVTRDPLKLEITSPLPQGLNPYETEFLDAFKSTTHFGQQQALQNMVINLVKSISEKMKGFSQKETVAYYKDIMTRAWQEVESADTPEVKSQKFDQSLEWTMLDHQFNDRTQTVFGPSPIFLPLWWGRFDPVYRSQGPAMPTSFSSSAGGSHPSMSVPSLPGSAFAASMINGASTFAAGAIGNVQSFTGGITAKTNPAPPPSASSGGFHGGGGHCACACACAGCACACAGGGR